MKTNLKQREVKTSLCLINPILFMKKIYFFFLIIFYAFNQQIKAQNESKYLAKSTISISGASNKIVVLNNNFIIQQSIGQQSPIGTFTNSNYVIRQGFIQPNIYAKIIDNYIPLDLDVSIFPNPFINSISILFNNNIESDINIQIYDVLAHLLYSKKYLWSKKLTIELENLSTGIYLLKINVNNKQTILKIIKK